LKMFVAGKDLESTNSEYVDVRNPARHSSVVDRVPKGTKEDAKAAIDAAEDTFCKNPQWSSTHESRFRGKILWKIAELADQMKDELAKSLTLEQGKPLKESKGEIESWVNTFEYFAGFRGKLEGRLLHTRSGDRLLEVREILEPLGVCGAITPWNYPISLLGRTIAPSLMAGNTIVIKPSITTPLTTLHIAKLMSKAGLPDGVVNVVTGPSNEVGNELVSNNKVRKIGFTGSTDTGKRILLEGADQIKRVSLELGGSDPTVVCDDADLEEAAQTVVMGRYTNCGQNCTAIKRVYVFEKIAGEFVKRLKEKVSALKVGPGTDPSTTMGPLHNASQLESVESMVNNAMEKGAKAVAGGKKPKGDLYSDGYFYEPTVLVDLDDHSTILTEECFGPALPIATVTGLDEAIEKANRSNYGLGSSIWTKSEANQKTFEQKIEAGMICVNSTFMSIPEASFVGVKDSGVGTSNGPLGLLEYLRVRSVRKPIS